MGRLMNVLLLQDDKGNPLEHGSLKDGNGTLYIYDEIGNKTKERRYKDCHPHGKKEIIKRSMARASSISILTRSNEISAQ